MKNILVVLIMSFLIVSCSDSPTCDDGIQNGDESGIDCGRDCTACASCTDGIQNGNESGIDCGGECDPCIDKQELLIGDWKVETFIGLGGTNLIGTNREELFFKFLENGAISVFSHFTNGINVQVNKEYTIGGDFEMSFYFDGEELVMVDCEFTDNDNTLNLSGIWIGEPVNAKLVRVTEDLCSGTNCNDGESFYGYCVCPSGVEGTNCEVTRGPAGGIIIHDKGSFSDGWQYIEVHTALFSDKPVGCSNLEGKSSFNSIGTGKSNTANINIYCPTGSGHAARDAINFSVNGYDDWYLPSLDELRAIGPFQKYIIEYDALNPYRDLQTSSFVNKQSWVVKFKPEGTEWFKASALVGREFLVIRNY